MTELSQAVAGLDAKKRELLALLAKQKGIDPSRTTILPVPRTAEDYPASFAQERLWFLDQMRPGDPAQNVPVTRMLWGHIKAPLLRRALSGAIRRHEALRTRFRERDGRPVQVIVPASEVEEIALPVIDLRALPLRERAAEVSRLYDERVYFPFDIERGPLLRACLLRLEPNLQALQLEIHHIISDGWSLGVLLREITALYDAEEQGAPPSREVLPPLPIQYVDFAVWQREWLRGETLEQQLGYWRRRLAGSPPALELPADRPRPAFRTSRGRRLQFTLAPGLAGGISALGRRTGSTLFMVLLAAFATLLRRIAGITDLPVGSPVAGRNRRELEPLIGLFVNSLVLRLDVDGDPSFEALLGRVQRVALDAFGHQDLPFEKLVEELRPERALNRQPLFQVMFVLQNTPDPVASESGARGVVDSERPAVDSDLSLTWQESGDFLTAVLEYSLDLFDPPTIRRLGQQLEALLAGAVAGSGRSLSELPLLSGEERHQLLVEWAGGSETTAGACLHERFREQALRDPERLALVCGEERLSYGELERRAGLLALRLRAAGVGPESRVALCFERSPEMIVAVLAVLVAGGAYVPLDPAYPEERLAFLLADCGAEVLLTVTALAERLPAAAGCRMVCLDGADPDPFSPPEWKATASPSNLAYIIYTSGSTGRPKGVMVTHGQASRLFDATRDWFGFGPDDVWTLFHSYAFDFSVWEIWGALLHGGRLVVVPHWVSRSPEEFHELLGREGVTVLNQTPSAFRQLIRADESATAEQRERLALRWVIFGGEALDPAALAPWVERHGAERPRLANMYGITETTVHVTWRLLGEGDVASGGSRIGRPIPDLRLYLAEDGMRSLQPLPIGAPGEILVGGAGVARGYLGRPALTAERFVPDPFGGSGERLYRSGDLARRLPDGDLEFLGRIDGQVKVRGFRIEPGEIEAALEQHPGVDQAAVLVDGTAEDDRRLTAYVAVRAGAEVTAADLRGFLAARLPEHMIPAGFAMLAVMPLTAHGKVDRKALAQTAVELPAGGGREIVPPRTPAEEILAGIWSELLGASPVGVFDSFFELGGHSLLAARLMSRVRSIFGVELELRSVFEEPTVAALAARIDRLQGGRGAARVGGSLGDGAALLVLPPVPPLLPVAREAGPSGAPELPLSFAQRRLWLIERLSPGPAYNIPAALRLRGPLDAPTLRRALSEVVARHEILRTTFHSGDSEPVQRIAPPRPFPLPLADLSGLGTAAAEREARRLAAAEALRIFDLENGPVIFGLLVRLAPEDHAVCLTMHHIASDGWSIQVLTAEMAALYAAAVLGNPSPLLPLPVQYGDFAVWQRGWLTDEMAERQLGFWREALAGAPAVLELPADRPRPALPSGRGGLRAAFLPAAVIEPLAALGRREGASLFMVFLAAWKTLLWRLTGQADLPVGTVVAGRDRLEIEHLIGFFVNTLVLRTNLEGDGADAADGPSFQEALARVRATALAAFAHQDVPFERLVEELAPGRSLSHTPLFQVVLTLEAGAAGGGGSAAGAPRRAREEARTVTMAPFGGSAGNTAKFDLTLSLAESGPGHIAYLEHNRDLFDGTTAERLLGSFASLVSAVAATAAGPGLRLGELTLLSALERHQLLAEWNDASRPYPAERCVHELFAEQAARSPESPAVAYGGLAMTYGELADRAGRLARHLRGLGVGPEVRVAVCAERSPDLIVGLLAVLEAGGAYVPLDPGYPRERLALLVEDSRPRVLLAQEALLDRLPEPGAAVRVLLDAVPDEPAGLPSRLPGVSPGNAAYVLYTSGSTGRPKGVEVPHRAIVRLVREAGDLQVGPADRVAQASSSAFDAATFEIWGALLNGACLVGLERDVVISPRALAARLAEERISVLFLTTALFHQVAREAPEAFAPLRRVLFGGEAVDPRRVREVLTAPPERLLHVYGPTESTTFATSHRVERVAPGAATVPIGRPIANTSAWVLDAAWRPVPASAAGELFLGGDGLARGYLGRPDLTAERFLPDAWSGALGARVYRTGDRVRMRADGALEFLGRTDFQVKLRGFRIEPGEVEAAIALHPEVAQAAVLLREDGAGERRLVAYVAPAVPARLRPFLADRLPEFMVPAAFVALEALPLNPNGKVDRRALPAPAADGGLAPREDFVAPRNPIEQALAGIWSELLGVSRVGVHDSFFELGGHSLLAARLSSRVRADFGVELELRAVFEEPALAAIAARVGQLLDEKTAAAPPTVVPAVSTASTAPVPPVSAVVVPVPRRAGPTGEPELPLSYAQQRLWFLERLAPGAAYNIPVALWLRGPIGIKLLERALTEVVARHEVLRSTLHPSPDGAEPVQRIAAPKRFPLPRIDLSSLLPTAAEAEARRLATEEALRPFDLETGPVIRGMLVRLAAREHAILLTMHHIASDGWSIEVLTGEMGALYGAFLRGQPSPLPPLAVQYGDYAVWQRAWLTPERLERQLRFWRKALAGAPAVLELPADRPRPALASGRGGLRTAALPAAAVESLAAHGRRAGASVFMVLLAAWNALLWRLTGQTDLPVGTVVAGRDRMEIEPLVGFFVNTLVLRTDLQADDPEGPSFAEAVVRVRSATLSAFAHQDVPFERLVEELAPGRSLAHTPLFQVEFSHQAAANVAGAGGAGGGSVLRGLTLEQFGVSASDEHAAKFDLSLTTMATRTGYSAFLEINRDLFDGDTGDRLLASYAALLEAAAQEPVRPLGELPIFPAAERRQLLAEWEEAPRAGVGEGAGVGVGVGEGIHERIAAQAAARPQAVALIDGGREVTYGELRRRSAALAGHLRRLGVGPEVRVALAVERSAEAVAGMLGVLEAGGAYVPLDPAHPGERLAGMVEDSGASVVLIRQGPAPEWAAGRQVAVIDAINTEPADPGPPPAAWPGSAAYVLYTSGSTGKPKGVVVEHRSLAGFALEAADAYGISAGDRCLQFAALSFDTAAEEIYPCLAAGGTLVLRQEGMLDSPRHFVAELGRLEIAFADLPTAWWHELAAGLADEAGSAALPATLRTVVIGGEKALAERLALWAAVPGAERVRLINTYGPTETTVVATRAELAPDSLREAPIGRAIPGARTCVVDAAGRLLPSGAAGELWIGGRGVSRGYLGRPELTAAAFVPDPFGAGSGERLYRTGDRVRRRRDGALEFLGRIDAQVKVRGFRIELGEIENALVRHPAVRSAAAAVQAGAAGPAVNAPRLVAYIVAADPASPPPAAELRRFLGGFLPEPLVPAAFAFLPELPLTPHGKVDRRALAAAAAAAGLETARSEEGFVPPQGPVEEVLAGIWGEVLGVERVGAHDDFFQLSGHSLLATQVIYRVRKAFGVDLPLRRLFEGATLAELALEIETAAKGDAAGAAIPPLEPLPPGRPAALPASYFQEWAWHLQGGAISARFNLPSAFRALGRLDLAALRGAFAEVIRRHESLRVVFREEGGQVLVEADPSPDLAAVPIVDLSALPEDRRGPTALLLADEDAFRAFDLSRGPVAMAQVMKLAERDHILLFNMHHIVSDGWSIEVFQRELTVAYWALARGEEPALPELPLQFSDYAAWQRRALSGGALAAHFGYWQRQLAGFPPPLELATRLPRPQVVGTRAVASGFLLTGEREQALRALGRSTGSSVSMQLVAVYLGLLHRYSGREDLVIGSVFSGRNRPELAGLIGLFINSVALRTDLSGSPSFREILGRVRETVLGGYAHGDVPFPKVLAELVPGRPLGRLGLFRTMFNMLSFPSAGAGAGAGAAAGEAGAPAPGSDLDLREIAIGDKPARYDLVLEGQELPGTVSCLLVGAADLFTPDDIAEIRDDFESLLMQALADPDTPLGRLLPGPRFRPDEA